MGTLPSHHQLFASLLSSISNIVPQTANPAPSSPQSAPGPATTTSLLESIPETQRPLLLTLHVIFPSLLLPAFDLLDRRLVIRLCREETDVSSGEDPDTRLTRTTNHGTNEGDDVFLVRSIATTMKRRGRDHSGSSQCYIVHLGAWNCSCASFTIDTFPSDTGPASERNSTTEAGQPCSKWLFSGLGLFGISAHDVPCCKHILACLLVTKWPSMTGQDIEKRKLTRDQMAGIMAEI